MLADLRVAGVIHRDLKPENLLLTGLPVGGGGGEGGGVAVATVEGQPAAAPLAPPPSPSGVLKLIDFGSAKPLFLPPQARKPSGNRATSFVGTAEYVSPEVLGNQGVCFASDLWALGCLLYQMLAGAPPFRGQTEYLTLQAVGSGRLPPRFPRDFPADARDLVTRLLRRDPDERIGADDLAELRAHAFFEGVNWAALRPAAGGEQPQPAPTIAGCPPPLVGLPHPLDIDAEIPPEERAALVPGEDDDVGRPSGDSCLAQPGGGGGVGGGGAFDDDGADHEAAALDWELTSMAAAAEAQRLERVRAADAGAGGTAGGFSSVFGSGGTGGGGGQQQQPSSRSGGNGGGVAGGVRFEFPPDTRPPAPMV